VGQGAIPLPLDDRYLGFGLARGQRPGEVERAPRHVLSLLRIRIESA
jgi:hypothetical protein